VTEVIEQLEAAIVPVHIEKDNRPKKRRYLRTTLHSYSVDPVTNTQFLALPYNPRRHFAIVTTNDAAVILTKDNPTTVPIVSTAASPPPGASVHIATMGNGFPGYQYFGPDAAWIVAVSGAAATRVCVVQHIWCEE
jgi:hypothetical protein